MKTARTKQGFDGPTWIIAGTSAVLLAALFVAGRGTLLRIAIPAAAAFIGLSLYLRKPYRYLQFTLWCWFVTPLVRRLVDWRAGFVFQNLVLLTPFLVSAIAVLSVRDRHWRAHVNLTPFIFCLIGVSYGFCIGILTNPSGEVIYGLVDWLSPMFIGLHLYLRHEEYEENLAAIQNAAVWGLLLMGIYGIYQFYEAPIWDTAWLSNLPGGIESSTFGRPEVQEIRVWSTGNAPGQFASVLVTLFFFLNGKRSFLKPFSFMASIYTLLLTLVRTAWLAGIVGVLYLAKASNPRRFPGLLLGIGSCAIALVVVANSSLNIPILQDRFKTLTDLKQDVSVRDRTALYEGLTGEVLAQPVGIGLNNQSFYHGYPLDSGILRMLLSLGWFGTLAYSIGILRILALLFSGRRTDDPTLAGCKAIAVMLVVELASGPTLVGAVGAMFWTAVGLGLASRLHAFALVSRPMMAEFAEAEPLRVGHAHAWSSEIPRY